MNRLYTEIYLARESKHTRTARARIRLFSTSIATFYLIPQVGETVLGRHARSYWRMRHRAGRGILDLLYEHCTITSPRAEPGWRKIGKALCQSALTMYNITVATRNRMNESVFFNLHSTSVVSLSSLVASVCHTALLLCQTRHHIFARRSEVKSHILPDIFLNHAPSAIRKPLSPILSGSQSASRGKEEIRKRRVDQGPDGCTPLRQ